MKLDHRLPVYARFPDLKNRVKRVALGSWPTPIETYKISGHSIRIKNDGKSRKDHGGNKIRKFEFVLADALTKGAEWLYTVGGTGSNHVLAMGVLAKEAGLRSAAVVFEQPKSTHVDEKLRAFEKLDIRLKRVPFIWQIGFPFYMFRRSLTTKKNGVYALPGGASNPLGTLGYVNAAFELEQQLKGKPWPARIYLPVGSCGTTAGLLLGLSILGADTELHPVRVTSAVVSNKVMIKNLARRTYKRLDPAGKCPKLISMKVRGGYLGKGYGHSTERAEKALAAAGKGGLKLDPTYTSKAMACLLDDLEAGNIDAGDVMFWNTYSSV